MTDMADRGPQSLLGPKVLGKEAFERQQADQTLTAMGRLGPRVVDSPAEERVGVAVAEAPETGESMSVKTLRELLTSDPANVDRLIVAELDRPDPRRSAMKALYEAEQKGKARAEMVEKISEAYTVLFGEGIGD